MQSVAEPRVAEGLAIKWDLQTSHQLKLQKIIVQSDALGVVDCMNHIAFSEVLEPIMLDCTELVNLFSFVSVMFIRRNCNVDVHHLIRICKTVGCNLDGLYPRAEHLFCLFACCWLLMMLCLHKK
ncbi:unnamed protein product [Vicia faba]|uniref:RNase H type-1 domain-containing protein n=1 Tax=Vicia faba TaxID=3906 RepID=A0AAV0YDF6_VICFA|nr:unnamed protein product [Vicia faba]